MKPRRPVPHSRHVDLANVRARFVDGTHHRAYLSIPFLGSRGSQTLCVIGQNPSAANEVNADKTIRYVEELVALNHRKYCRLIILNLYSQVDTTKTKATPPLHPTCDAIFRRLVRRERDFLLVFGKLRNQRQYRFSERARQIAVLFNTKNVLKLDLGTTYAPHPGNSRVLYRNFGVGFAHIAFSDLVDGA